MLATVYSARTEPAMRQYDVVIARLATRTRPDEEALTDLLNERARAGWDFDSVAAISATRVMVVFSREAE
jgi:hypothetical protein